MKKETINKANDLLSDIQMIENELESINSVDNRMSVYVEDEDGDIIWSAKKLSDRIMKIIKLELEHRLITAKLELETLTDYESKPTE